jgi:putative acetyltransferase
LSGLRAADVTFWSIWRGEALAGFGALKQLSAGHGEVKSMRTAAPFLRQGAASALLRHIIAEAQRRGYTRLSLETGSMPFFAPAHRLYRSFGFVECKPFGDYRPDPNSTFMTLSL